VAVSRTRSGTRTATRLTRDPDGIFPARSRSPQCEPGITRKPAVAAGGHRAAPPAGQHLPRSTGAVAGQDAGRRPGSRSQAAARAGSARRVRSPGPITVPAALNTSRCRTQAESAGRADRRLMAEPSRKRRHAKLRKAIEHPVMSPYLVIGSHQPKECTSAAVCALLQTRADYATQCGPSHISEPIPNLSSSRLCRPRCLAACRSSGWPLPSRPGTGLTRRRSAR
jgi:hypothetical protein